MFLLFILMLLENRKISIIHDPLMVAYIQLSTVQLMDILHDIDLSSSTHDDSWLYMFMTSHASNIKWSSTVPVLYFFGWMEPPITINYIFASMIQTSEKINIVILKLQRQNQRKEDQTNCLGLDKRNAVQSHSNYNSMHWQVWQLTYISV